MNSGVTVLVARGQPLGRTLSCCDWLTGTPGPPMSSAATGVLSLRLMWRKMDVCRARQQLWCERECGCVRVSESNLSVPSSVSHCLKCMRVKRVSERRQACVYVRARIHRQTAGVPHKRSVFNHVVAADSRWRVGRDTHALPIYIHERPSLPQPTGSSLC